MKNRDINKAVAEFEAYTEAHPTDYRAELTGTEIQDILKLSEDETGSRDYFQIVTTAYAMGFSEGYKRGRK